ncbi:MAG: Smr/MutS family protein [Chitinophagales bacterium]|nr:Smr/MutS family protein [Chitinophagaceae bacterium]MCB9064404.1 Smr/MutS family protein [Chitinophagales bacterium]
MKFSIGDKVIFKHTDEEGHIVAYISNDMVEVDVDGTTFPVHVDEIDHPYLKWFTEKKVAPAKKKAAPEQLPVEKETLRKPKLAKGVYLSFIPVFKQDRMEDVVDALKVYLLNELPKEIQYNYTYDLLGNEEFGHEGKLHGFAHVYLHEIPFDDMNDQPRFNWQADDLDDADMAPAKGQLRIKPHKVFQHINNLLVNGEPSFSYMLFDDFKPEARFVQEEKSSQVPKQTVKPSPINNQATLHAKYELDLHIEHLVDSTRGMTNADIVQVQLSTLQTYLRLAINAHQEYMVVIHGLGKGKLRDEVHKILDETPEVADYKNEWHGKYGFGATEIKFGYK